MENPLVGTPPAAAARPASVDVDPALAAVSSLPWFKSVQLHYLIIPQDLIKDYLDTHPVVHTYVGSHVIS